METRVWISVLRSNVYKVTYLPVISIKWGWWHPSEIILGGQTTSGQWKTVNKYSSFFLSTFVLPFVHQRRGSILTVLHTVCHFFASPTLFFSCSSFFLLTVYVKPIHSVGFPRSSAGQEAAWNAGDPGWIPGSGRSAGEGIGYPCQYSWASLVAQRVKNPPAMQETWVQSLDWEDPLEKGKATRSSILAWRIPWTVASIGGRKELDTTKQLSLSIHSVMTMGKRKLRVNIFIFLDTK